MLTHQESADFLSMNFDFLEFFFLIYRKASYPLLCILIKESQSNKACALAVCRLSISFSFCFYISVQFSHSVVSDSLRRHESQHTRPPCPSPTPGVYSNSSPSSWRCHPANSSSVIPFSSCPQSLPTSGSFPVSQLFS